jgi:hypothetical protein
LEITVMTNRREFVRTVAMVPFAGLFSMPFCRARLDDVDSNCRTVEPTYAGKPLSYWLARVVSQDYDHDVRDMARLGLFRHFGDIAIPGLIGAMRNDCWFMAGVELEMIGTPATVRALTQALEDKDVRVRRGAASALYGIRLHKGRTQPELDSAFREAFPFLKRVVKSDCDKEVARLSAWILCGFAQRGP